MVLVSHAHKTVLKGEKKAIEAINSLIKNVSLCSQIMWPEEKSKEQSAFSCCCRGVSDGGQMLQTWVYWS